MGANQYTISITKNPDSKVHGANVGSIWGRQDPGGPHVGHMDFAIWELQLLLYLNPENEYYCTSWSNPDFIRK